MQVSKPPTNTAILRALHSLYSRAKKLSSNPANEGQGGTEAHSGEALAKSETFRQ